MENRVREQRPSRIRAEARDRDSIQRDPKGAEQLDLQQAAYSPKRCSRA